jgi:signal transduction histidine kinase
MNGEALYVGAVLVTSGFVTAVAAWLWSDDLDLSGRLFVAALLAHPVLGLFVVAELLAPTRSLAVTSYAVHTALSLIVPIGYFLFAFTFASNRRHLPRRLLAGVGIYAAVVVGLEVSNPIHHLARDGYEVVGAAVPHVTATPTTAFGLLTLPSFVAYYAAIGILAYRFLARREGRWMQTLVLFVGFAPPFVVSSLWFSGLLVGPLDGGFVIGSAWTAAFAGWAVYRYQLFDVVPLAREAVFEVLDERVIVVDEERRLLDYNDDAAGTFPELVGTPGRHIDDVLPALVDDATPADGDWGETDTDPFVSTFTKADGSTPREYTVTVTRLDEGGRLRGYAVVVRDITDRQRRIRDLERQKAQLERFASTLSHDIRNPLNVARGRAELARDRTDSDHLEQVIDSLDRIDRIIDDLLTLSREGRTIDDRQRVSLVDVARSAWETTDTGDATLVLDMDDRTAVYADRTRLLNVFENLFRNSVEHGSTDSRTQSGDSAEHGGPTVTVTLGRHDDGFYVEDDGPGIPPDHRESVFEYEYTTAGGTGLGLAIVDAIAEAHGWRTTAAEGSDDGARIVFSGVSLIDDATDAGTRSDRDAGAPEVEM